MHRTKRHLMSTSMKSLMQAYRTGNDRIFYAAIRIFFLILYGQRILSSLLMVEVVSGRTGELSQFAIDVPLQNMSLGIEAVQIAPTTNGHDSSLVALHMHFLFPSNTMLSSTIILDSWKCGRCATGSATTVSGNRTNRAVEVMDNCFNDRRR